MSYYNPITTIASVGGGTLPVPVTIASPSEPATRPNGGQLRQGDNWYNTATDADYIWIVEPGTDEGSWRIIGSGASGGTIVPGGETTFDGGFVPNTIFVGGSANNPNLTLSDLGGIIANQEIRVNTPVASGVAIGVADKDRSIGFRVLGDGTVETGRKTGDLREEFDGIRLNPTGTIEMGGSTLRVEDNDLYINDILVIQLDSLDTANVRLVNPTDLLTANTSLTALPPLVGLSSQEDFNIWLFNSVTYLDGDKIGQAPNDGKTYGRRNRQWVPVTGITPKGTVDTVADLDNIIDPVNGDLYVVEATGDAYVYEDGEWNNIGPIQGPPGPPGPDGEPATVTVGATETLPAGSPATVNDSSTNPSAAILDFGIPQGATGPQGEQGDPGPQGQPGEDGKAAHVFVSDTITGPPGSDADVADIAPDGSNDAILQFTIPRGVTGAPGETGPEGPPGKDGTDGVSPTVEAGETETVSSDESALVTNVGTDTAAIFNFEIPQGAPGTPGEPGADGTPGAPGEAASVQVGSTDTLEPGADATVVNATQSSSNVILDFGIPQGVPGVPGQDGAAGTAATVDVDPTTITGAAGSNAAVTNQGTTSAANFQFTIPRGNTGEQGPKGDPGTSIAIAGTVATVGDLPDYASAGTMYIVADSGDGYVSDGALPTSDWTNVGKIQGPEGPQGPPGPVAGSNTQIIFNDNGAASGASDLTFDNNTLSTAEINVAGDVTATAFIGDGSQLTGLNIPNALSFKGPTDITGAAPVLTSADNGFFYINTVTGVASEADGWVGLDGDRIVQEQLLFWTGAIWFAGGVQDITASLPLAGGTMTGNIVFASTQTFPATGLPAASTTLAGIVQLSNSVVSELETQAPTLKAIKGINDQVTTNTTDIATNATNISNNTAAILQNTNNISQLTTDLGTTDAQVETNKQDIATNTTDIANVKVTADGALQKAGGTMSGNITMGGTTVINFSSAQTFPTDIDIDPSSLPDATTNQAGIVRLSNDKSSTSETLAPTMKALSETNTRANDSFVLASAALPTSGGTMTGDIVFAATQEFPIPDIDSSILPAASLRTAGIVQLSDATDGNSVAEAATENAVRKAFDRGSLGVTQAADAQLTALDALTLAQGALPTVGGTMTGDIVFAESQTFPGAGIDSVNGQTGPEVFLTASDVNALPIAGGTMLGEITFAPGQTFPGAGGGTVLTVNDISPDSEGNVTLTAANVGAVASTGGAFTGNITGPATEDADPDGTYTTKGYVLSKLGSAGQGSVTQITAGQGLTTGSADPNITTSGTLTVEAADATIDVSSDGIKVDKQAAALVFSVNGQQENVILSAVDVAALPLSGGTLSGSLAIGANLIDVDGTILTDSLTSNNAIIVDTGVNTSATIPLYEGKSANTTKFIVESDGTIRVGSDLDMESASGGDKVTIKADGSVTAVSFAGDGSALTGVTGTDPNALAKTGGSMTGNINMDTPDKPVIIFNDNQTFPSNITPDPSNLPSATINSPGIVQLSNSVSSSSETLASTPEATKTAFDAATAAASAAAQAQSDASDAQADATAAANVASNAQNTANAALPKAGGTMTGGLVGTSADFSGKVTSAQTLDGDADDVLTTKAYVLSKVSSAVIFEGNIDVTTENAPQNPTAGEFYLNTVAGTPLGSWTGITEETVAANQFVFFTSGNVWELGGIEDASNAVTITTNQSITGVKTFTSQVGIPETPTADASAASKKYVDDQITAIDTSSDVTSVNGKSGAVTLNASDVGALPTAGGTMTGNIIMSEGDSAVIVFSSQQQFPNDIPVNPDNLPEASGNTQGITFLSDSTSSNDSVTEKTAATPRAVKEAFDLATTANTAAGTAASAASTAQATANTAVSDAANAQSTADAADTKAVQAGADAATAQSTANAALPKAGGTMSGTLTSQNITIANGFTISGDGSGLTNLNIPPGISYQGTINCTTEEAPESPSAGNMFLNTQTGAALDSWTGLTSVQQSQFVLYNGSAWQTGAILDGSTFVTLGTTQSITGAKTFTKEVTIPDNPSIGTSATNKNYVDATIGNNINAINFPVDSVNGKQDTVILNATDVGALPSAGGEMTGNITMTGSTLVEFSSAQTFPGTITSLPAATADVAGVSFLSDSVTSDKDVTDQTAATPKAVKSAQDAANSAAAAAGEARTVADTALSNAATNAQDIQNTEAKAQAAVVAAGNAQTDATQALSDAEAAQATADAAVPKIGDTTITGAITVSGNITASPGFEFIGDGSGLTNLNIPPAVQYKGTINATTTDAPDSPQAGWVYLNTVSGTPQDSWTGLTEVKAEEFILYSGEMWEGGAVLDDTVYVTLATNQTVAGQKTFTSQVIVPVTPSQDQSASSKSYVDSQISTSISAINFPVDSVNGKTQAVILNSTDVGALALTGGTLTGNLTMSEADSAIIKFSTAQTFPDTIVPNPALLPVADADTAGITKLLAATDSSLGTDDQTAATPSAVKAAMDAATAAQGTANTAVTNAANAQSTADTAETNAQTGITNAANAQATADAALPKTGGTLSGDLTVDGNVTATATHKFIGDGSGLTNLNIPQSLTFKGTTNVTQDAPPAVNGDFYLNIVQGAADVTWSGLNEETIDANQFVLYNGASWSAGSVLDGSAFVTLATIQTVTGKKTFTNAITIPTTPTADGDATSKSYVDSAITSGINGISIPVTSVNGQAKGVDGNTDGAVVLDSSDVGALALSGGLMGGLITFAQGQTFPGAGDVSSVNNIEPVSGNVSLTATDVQALPLSGGTMTGTIVFNATQKFLGVLELGGGTMTGQIVFASGQTFPGTVTTVNGNTGTVTLNATDVGAIANVSGSYTQGLSGDTLTLSGDLTTTSDIDISGGALEISDVLVTDVIFSGSSGGSTNIQVTGDGSIVIGQNLGTESAIPKITLDADGNINLSGIATSRATTDEDGADTLATKEYVLTKFGQAGNGTVTEVTAGSGLQTDLAGDAPITGAGTLSVKAADSTIVVTADGVAVNQQSLISDVTSVNGKSGAVTLTSSDVGALPITGGVVTGDLNTTGTLNVGTDSSGDNGNINLDSTGTITTTGDILTGPTGFGSAHNKDGVYLAGNLGKIAIYKSAEDVQSWFHCYRSDGEGTGTSTVGVMITNDFSITTLGNVTANSFIGDGSQLTNLNVPQSVVFKGDTNVANPAPAAVAGDFYLNTVGGQAADSWTGIQGQTVLQNQFVFYSAAGEWVEGGIQDASAFVTLTGNQTINGTKTFNQIQDFEAGIAVDGGDVTVAAGGYYYGDGSKLTGIASAVTSVNGLVGDVKIGVEQLDDFSASGPVQDGNILVYNAGTQEWNPITPDYGVLSVNQIAPDDAGNVTLTANSVGALALTGGTVSGDVVIGELDGFYIDLDNNGIGTFSVGAQIGGDPGGGANDGVINSNFGLIKVSSSSTNVFEGYTTGTSAATSAITRSGGASFSDDVTNTKSTSAGSSDSTLTTKDYVDALVQSGGSVQSVNDQLPNASGNVTLTSSNVDAVSATTGGNFNGNVKIQADEPLTLRTPLTDSTIALRLQQNADEAPHSVWYISANGNSVQDGRHRCLGITANNTLEGIDSQVFSGFNADGQTSAISNDGRAGFMGVVETGGIDVRSDGAIIAQIDADGILLAEYLTDGTTTKTMTQVLAGGGGGGSSVSVGENPPAAAAVGDLWWDSINGIMYVWYQDQDQTSIDGQWVDTRPGALVPGVVSVNDQTGTVTLTAGAVGALPISGGTLSGNLNVTGEIASTRGVSFPSIKLTGMTDHSVPYIAPDGTLTAMEGVEFNPTSKTLKISKLESPVTGDIAVHADFGVHGPVSFSNSLTVDKLTSLKEGLSVIGTTSLQGVNVTGDIAQIGNQVVTGNVTASGTVNATAFVGDGSGLTNLPLPTATSFKGAINVVDDNPPAAVNGDIYSNTKEGTVKAGYTGIAGDTVEANQLVFYAGGEWHLGGKQVTTNLMTLTSDQTVSGAKTFSDVLTVNDNLVVNGSGESKIQGSKVTIGSTISSASVVITSPSLEPASTTPTLGKTTARWSKAFLTDLDIAGTAEFAGSILPSTNGGSDLGSATKRFDTLYVNHINDSGPFEVTGSTTLADVSVGTITSNLVTDDITRDLGTSAAPWNNLYLANTVQWGVHNGVAKGALLSDGTIQLSDLSALPSGAASGTIIVKDGDFMVRSNNEWFTPVMFKVGSGDDSTYMASIENLKTESGIQATKISTLETTMTSEQSQIDALQATIAAQQTKIDQLEATVNALGNLLEL